MRTDGRSNSELRKVIFTPDVNRYAEGSVQIDVGHTRLICTATVEPNVPKWLQGQGSGWISAEYGMLPRSTHTRMQREKTSTSGRSQEISRLIGRSLRAAVDLKALGEKQIQVDCDVLQADGGTRTAAITGGFVAVGLALKFMKSQGQLTSLPIKNHVAAISVGLFRGEPILDLNYDEDSNVDTDMNIVMTSKKELVEVQGTAEGSAFSFQQMNAMLEMAQLGCQQLFQQQQDILNLK
jgi:ribonuclease PH